MIDVNDLAAWNDSTKTPASDPVTEDWLLAVGFYRGFRYDNEGTSHLCIDHADLTPALVLVGGTDHMWSADLGGASAYWPHDIFNRVQLVLLLAALGINIPMRWLKDRGAND